MKNEQETQEMVKQLEKMLEAIEDAKLLSLAKERENSETISFEDFIEGEGFSLEEIDRLSDTVDIE